MLQQTVLQRYARRRAPAAVGSGRGKLDAGGEELPQTLRLLVRRLKRGQLNADINVRTSVRIEQSAGARRRHRHRYRHRRFAYGPGALSRCILRCGCGIPLFPLLGARPAPAWRSWRCDCGVDAFGVIRQVSPALRALIPAHRRLPFSGAGGNVYND
ncbi:hypothetical protein M8494_07595 [Serratia ureilytica]